MLNPVKRCKKVPFWGVLPVIALLWLPTVAFSQQDAETARYDFVLSPDKIDNKDEYTRLEVESFMCANALGYIRAEETIHKAKGGYCIDSSTIGPQLIRQAKEQVINKWFEDRVTVTVKGDVSSSDKSIIKRFYKTINGIINENKFIFDPKLEVANIVIRLKAPTGPHSIQKYLGESAVLKDNLRIRITVVNEKIKLAQYKAGSGKLINNASFITLTPAEMDFRRNNRFVKVYIKKVHNPVVLHFALIHELFHTIGFPGHSPYYESHLFPLPVEVYKWKPQSPFLAPLAETMVAMLYRPEILPGMTVEEAGAILTILKRLNKTEPATTKTILLKRKVLLEKRQKALMDMAKANYDNRMRLFLELDKWANKEGLYLQELEEIKKAKKEAPKVVRDINNATSYMFKLIRIRRELIVVKGMRDRLLEKTEGRKKTRAERRKLKFWKEELVVLNDLLNTAKKIGEAERKINASHAQPIKAEIEKKLERVIRQITFIDSRLANL